MKLNAEEGIRAAFYVPYDAASFSSLREYARQIDLLFPDWLHIITPDGRLQSIDEQTNKFFDVMQDSTVRSVDDKVMPFLKSEDTGMEVFPMVNNFDGTDWVDVSAFLNNPDARARFRRQVATFLATDKYRGLMIDFETLSQEGQAGYLALLQGTLRRSACQGHEAVRQRAGAQPGIQLRRVAAHVDGVVLMNYDEHYPSPGTPGPVASQDWFTDNLKAAIKVIPKDKLISAIGNYGYDWVQKPKHGPLPPGVKDINVTVQDAWLAARDSEADVDFDGDSLNPHISYLDEHDLQHDIWFLDAVTALNQMRAAQSLGIKTFALWRLGSEDRSLWRVWDVPGEAGRGKQIEGCSARPGCGHGGQWRDPAHRGPARRWTTQHHAGSDDRPDYRSELRFAARALPGGALRIKPGQSRHHLRRRPRSGMDAQDSGRAQARTGAGGLLPDRNSGRQVFRHHRPHLPRGT